MTLRSVLRDHSWKDSEFLWTTEIQIKHVQDKCPTVCAISPDLEDVSKGIKHPVLGFLLKLYDFFLFMINHLSKQMLYL